MLIDFGFAVTLHGAEKLTPYGTPLYSAPEVLLSQAYDISVDVYSFGVLLYFMVVCQTPYDDVDVENIVLLKGIAQGAYRPLSDSFSADINANFDSVLSTTAVGDVGSAEVLRDAWGEVAILNLAAHCWETLPSSRPKIMDVCRVMEDVIEVMDGKMHHDDLLNVRPDEWVRNQLLKLKDSSGF